MHKTIVNVMLFDLKVFELFIVFIFHVLRVLASLLWTGLVVIEAARVGRVSNFRDDGTFVPPVVEIVPIYCFEKRMSFDLFRAIR